MIRVLRLSHRPERDKRLSTHVALVARAFGADEIVYTGVRDPEMEESVRKVVKNWGGNFKISYSDNWKQVVKGFPGKIVHLTMYGLPVDEVIPKLRGENLLIIVGGEKVPPQFYQLSDYNVAVGSQPHSEAAALAICLDRYYQGKPFKRQEGNLTITPSERGKLVKVKKCK